MREFGWAREMCFELDTAAFDVWGKWFRIINEGYASGVNAPFAPPTLLGSQKAHKSLQKCYEVFSREGKRANEFIDWIGYSIGIAWCSQYQKLPERVEAYLEDNFPWEELIQNPSDYLSQFLAENGSSGHLDYYPTPLSITTAMAMMLNPGETESVLEPCIGPGGMILPVKSLNIVGMDLNLLMVKAACIQAFFYKPQLLYVPQPIYGIHFHPIEMRVHQYFEFNTNTRIYCGNSLLGEFQAPMHIFDQDSLMIDVYVHPFRQRHRESFLYEEEMKMDWGTLSKDVRFKVVRAQARELHFDCVMTNPPFNSKLNAYEKEMFAEIERDNAEFLKERENTVVPKSITLMEQLTLF